MSNQATKQIRILSIEAWRDRENAWTWNQWHKVGSMYAADLSKLETGGKLDPRKLFAFMRSIGLLNDASKGKVAAEDDGHNYVVMAKGTREPLFAIEYGALDDTDNLTDAANSVNTSEHCAGPNCKALDDDTGPVHSPECRAQTTRNTDHKARYVCGKRARVLRKRGETVHRVGDTSTGKARYIWVRS